MMIVVMFLKSYAKKVEIKNSFANKESPLTLLLQYTDNWSVFVIEKN